MLVSPRMWAVNVVCDQRVGGADLRPQLPRGGLSGVVADASGRRPWSGGPGLHPPGVWPAGSLGTVSLGIFVSHFICFKSSPFSVTAARPSPLATLHQPAGVLEKPGSEMRGRLKRVRWRHREPGAAGQGRPPAADRILFATERTRPPTVSSGEKGVASGKEARTLLRRTWAAAARPPVWD